MANTAWRGMRPSSGATTATSAPTPSSQARVNGEKYAHVLLSEVCRIDHTSEQATMATSTLPSFTRRFRRRPTNATTRNGNDEEDVDPGTISATWFEPADCAPNQLSFASTLSVPSSPPREASFRCSPTMLSTDHVGDHTISTLTQLLAGSGTDVPSSTMC